MVKWPAILSKRKQLATASIDLQSSGAVGAMTSTQHVSDDKHHPKNGADERSDDRSTDGHSLLTASLWRSIDAAGGQLIALLVHMCPPPEILEGTLSLLLWRVDKCARATSDGPGAARIPRRAFLRVCFLARPQPRS